MDNLDLTVYEYLKSTLPVCYLTVRHDETRIRCPHCGDSIKNNKSAHCYIKNISPFPYYCQRCSSSGLVDSKFLNLLNAFNPNIGKYLKDSHTNYVSNLNRKYGGTLMKFKSKGSKIKLKPNQYSNKEIEKINYLNNRFGFELKESDIEKYKIILNFKDFLNNNGIDRSIYHSNKNMMIDKMDDSYVMFLLADGMTVNGRNIRPKDKKDKFYKFKLYEDLTDNSLKHYVISNKLDMSSRVFNIHIAEGIFDIISIFNNIYDGKQDSSTLFLANNGKGYLSVLNHLQSLGMLNCNINIYSDSDVSIEQLTKRLKNSLMARMNGIRVYYNKYNDKDKSIKDFGVDRSMIELSEPTDIRF